MHSHEYTLLGGINRAKVGRYITIASATVSGAAVCIVSMFVDIAKHLGINAALPPTILSLLGAGAVFCVLYWLFDRYVLHFRFIIAFLRVPNLNGEWNCAGQTLNPDKTPSYPWSGTITIVQTWDKIKVHMRTMTSESDSNTAALVYDDGVGYRLLYSYKNRANIDEPELSDHRGFAELVFDRECQTARGEYFNGHGRFTFGTLNLTKV